MGKSQREKGKAGERELSHKLNSLFNVSCRRGQQFSGIDGDDVVGLPGIHVECKRVERLNITVAVEQSVRDSKENELPIVCHRSSRQPWLVTMRIDDLPRITKLLSGLVKSEESEQLGSDAVSKLDASQ